MISFTVNNLLILIFNIILNYFFFLFIILPNAYPDIALAEVRPDLGNYSGRNDAVSRRPRDRSA